MDHALGDSSGISSLSPVQEYSSSFLQSFLPALSVVNQSAGATSVSDRFTAIQFAADASLAISGLGASWSDALSQRLVTSSMNVVQSSCPACDERQSRSSEASVSSSVSTSSLHPQSMEFRCSEEVCSRPESASSRLMRSYGNLIVQRKRGAGRRTFPGRLPRRGEGHNRSRHHELNLEASRSAILKKLALRNRNKRRHLKSALRPKSLRRVKSLARPSGRPSRPVEVVEEDQDLQSRFVALQRLVPGGSHMDTSSLLDETADFVMFLQMQVQAMQALANAVDLQQSREQRS